jgi:hypothetical protein
VPARNPRRETPPHAVGLCISSSYI